MNPDWWPLKSGKGIPNEAASRTSQKEGPHFGKDEQIHSFSTSILPFQNQTYFPGKQRCAPDSGYGSYFRNAPVLVRLDNPHLNIHVADCCEGIQQKIKAFGVYIKRPINPITMRDR